MSHRRPLDRLPFWASAQWHAGVKACVGCLLAWMPWCVAAPFEVVTSDYPPYSFMEGDAQKGIAVDVLKEAFARMKVELRVEFLPFPRAVQSFQRGRADGIFPFSVKEERLAYTLYSKEYVVADTPALFVRADSPITFGGHIGQLAQYVFGKQRDAFNGQVFADAVSQGVITKVEEAKDQRQVVMMLVASRFDIAVGPRIVVRYYAKETGNMHKLKELQPALEKPLPAYLGFSKHGDYTALAERFDQTLAQMHRDGSYQRIMDRYLN